MCFFSVERRLGHLIRDIKGTNGADAHRDIVEATIFLLLSELLRSVQKRKLCQDSLMESGFRIFLMLNRDYDQYGLMNIQEP